MAEARGRDHATTLGFWAAVATAVSAAIALGLGVTTPPRSGPNCSSDCITAPYTDAAAFVPRDYLWVYAASVMVLLFVVLVAGVHHAVADSHRVFSQVALSFAVIAAVAAVLDYAVQLSVLQAALLKGELEGLSLWSMYNPHGVFIALENAAYLLMAVSFVFLAAALPKVGGVVRAARVVLVAAGAIVVLSSVLLAVQYGRDLDYRFEVLAIGVDWLALIVAGALLAIGFRKDVIAPAES
ncbi:MAG TPA: hypothetical protein VIJ41_05285 [Candidatus Nanopelagicales bacterium]